MVFVMLYLRRLVSSVVVLSETERRVVQGGLGELLSPELSSNILWFFHRFCESYFMLNEEYYAAVSAPFFSVKNMSFRIWNIRSIFCLG